MSYSMSGTRERVHAGGILDSATISDPAAESRFRVTFAIIISDLGPAGTAMGEIAMSGIQEVLLLGAIISPLLTGGEPGDANANKLRDEVAPIRPYKVAVTDAALRDLRDRL